MDSIARNAAMVKKLHLPYPLLSDPEGKVIRRFGLWNQEEHVAIPAIVAIDTAGIVRYMYEGRDFADRPGDQAVFQALRETGGEPRRLSGAPESRVTAEEAAAALDSGRTPTVLEKLVPYYRGAYFTTVALKERLSTHPQGNREAIREIGRYQQMVKSYSDALQQTIEMPSDATKG